MRNDPERGGTGCSRSWYGERHGISVSAVKISVSGFFINGIKDIVMIIVNPYRNVLIKIAAVHGDCIGTVRYQAGGGGTGVIMIIRVTITIDRLIDVPKLEVGQAITGRTSCGKNGDTIKG